MDDMIPPLGSYLAEKYLMINSIFGSWHSPTQRTAAKPNMVHAVWLRTCYSPGSEKKDEDLVVDVDMDVAIDGDNRLLNDPNLYNFGSE
ncbi:MAG: hypothetical protein Q9213_001654 [Squamulea squamosa]